MQSNTETIFNHQKTIQESLRPPDGSWVGVDWEHISQSLPAVIRANAGRKPSSPAVIDEYGTLSFQELEEAANSLACALVEAAGTSPKPVALLEDTNRAAIIASLGILKAGKHLVGLATKFPIQRNLEIMQDAEVETLITGYAHLDALRAMDPAPRRILMHEDMAIQTAHLNLDIPLDSKAVLNYTSGSTGKPKGVLQTHRTAAVQAGRFLGYYHAGPSDRCTVAQSLAWAGAFWSIFGPLCHGAAVLPYDLNRMGMKKMARQMEITKPTIVIGDSATRTLVMELQDLVLPSCRLVTLGGDTIYKNMVDRFRQVFPNAVIAAGLGASETGRVTEMMFGPDDPFEYDIAPLGFPVDGVRILLLDENLEQVPQGEAGEIAVQSGSLAHGYLNRDELNAEKFRRIQRYGDTPVYLTGDMGRMDSHGVYHHLGRKDFQVKIRGYQVQTNEVEALLKKFAGVLDACAAAKTLPDGTKILVAYLVTKAPDFPGIRHIHRQMQKNLPQHTVPQHFMLLEALPKTMTNKTDRNALPAPEGSRALVEADYKPAQNEIQQELLQIWEEVLNLNLIGIHDDFLQLGGDSVLSTRLINRVMDHFNLRLTYQEIFDTQTIAEMAGLIESRMG